MNFFATHISTLVRFAFMCFALTIVVLVVGHIEVAYAEVFKLPTGKLCGAGFACPEGNTETEVAKNLVGSIAKIVKTMIGAIAIVVIVIAGVKLVTSQGNEEVFTTETRNLTFAVLGLFFIGLAGEISRIFGIDDGGFLKDPNVALQRSKMFGKTVQIVITFIKYIIGSISVLFIVRSALRLVTLGGNEEEVTKDKKNIGWGAVGLLMILFSNPIINKIFFKIDTDKFPGMEAVKPAIDKERLLQEIAGVTNLIASITGPVALLALVAGGLMYILAAGDEEKMGKAKKIITWSLIGIVIIYGAFAIVGTFVSRDFQGI